MTNRNEYIENLENLISDSAAKIWLNLPAWTELPTEEVFEDWLQDDFESVWNGLEEQDEERDFDEDNARLVESVERLDALMEANPGLVQLID